jgi:hypothetical protein
MSSIISAGTTVGTSLSLTGDTSGELQIQTNNGATTAMTLTTGGSAVFTAGTVSAPAITTTGDTNTGIFFPAADTIAFTEGGVESMRIDSSGNLRLSAGNLFWDVSGTRYISNVGDGSSNIDIQSRGFTTFSTGGATVGAGTERMRIDSSGNVGIGNSSPFNNASYTSLTIGGSKRGLIEFKNASNTNIGYQYVDADGNLNLETTGSVPLKFNTASTERMRIDSSGNLCVGTTTAGGAKTFINGLVATSSGYRWDGSSTGARGVVNTTSSLYAISGDGTTYGYGVSTNVSGGLDIMANQASQDIRFYCGTNNASPSERMRINSAGDVIINGSSVLQSAKLSVDGGSVAIENSGVDGSYQNAFVGVYSGNNAEHNVIRTAVSISPGDSGFQFMVSNGGGSSGTTQSFRINRTSCTVIGSLSKGSGSFRIDHPLAEKTKTHHLVHSFIEGPQADLIYRGVVNLVDGMATVNIDEAADMTEGTFEALCREVQCFTTNESDWTAVRGKVVGNILTIEAQDKTAISSISWMVIGERKDKHMYDTEWTDENGKVIVEPLKSKKEQ